MPIRAVHVEPPFWHTAEPAAKPSLALCATVQIDYGHVSFQEATVLPHSDGSVDVTLTPTKQEGPFRADARWSEIDGHILTTAAVRPIG